MSGFDVSIVLKLIDGLTSPARRAAQSYNSMAQSVARSSAQIGAATNAASASVNRLAKSMRNVRTLSSGFAGFGLGGGSAMMAFPLAHMLKNAANYEGKLLDIRKVWQGSTDDFDRMVRKLRALNGQIPMARGDIATLLEEGVKSGISRDVNELAEFTLAAAKFSTAFQMPNVEDAAQKLAKVKGALGLTMPEFTAMADSMNTVAGNFATTEADLLDIVRRVGGLSKAIGGSQGLADLIVIGGAQTAAGVKREVGATGLRTLLARLSTQPKDTREGLDAIGLNPDDVAKRLPTDMFGTVLEVLTRISTAPIHEQAGLLSKIAGMRTFDAFAPLLGNLELMERLKAIYDDPHRLTLDDEYARRITGINSALQLTSNILGELSDSIVMAWKPQIVSVLETLRNLSESLKGSRILQWTAGLLAGLAGLSLIALPFGILGASLFSMVLGFRALAGVARFVLAPLRLLAGVGQGVAQGVGLAMAEIASLGRAAYASGGALAALRFGLLALSRATLILGAIVMVVQYWDKLKAAAQGFASAFRGSELEAGLQKLASWSAPYLLATFQTLSSIAPGLASLLKSIGDSIASIFGYGSGESDSSGVQTWFDNAAAAAEKLLNPMRSIQEIGASIKGLFDWGEIAAAGAGIGVPNAMKSAAQQAKQGMRNPRGGGGVSPTNLPAGMSIVQQGPTVQVNQAPPNVSVSVTVNATTNADPNAIGAAAAGAVGAKVRGALSDAPHSAP